MITVGNAMRQRSRALDCAVYLLVRMGVCIVQALPWDAALALVDPLAWLMRRFNRRHRQVALENLSFAFPELSPAARATLVQDCYRHFATMIVEIIRLPRLLHRRTLGHYVQHGREFQQVFDWIHQGRPLIVVSGHLGNWEVLSYVAGLFGCYGASVARRLDNAYLHRFITRFRSKAGQVLLDKSGDGRRMVDFLRRGSWLAFVADQDAGPRGVFVDFFGRPASTFKSIAQLSLEYAAPVVVMGAVRIGQPMSYWLCVEDVIEPEAYRAARDAVRSITQRYTGALERMVRRHPEQYFWLHRRWKHQPAPASRAA